MTREEIQGMVTDEIQRIAPDAPVATTGVDEDLRDALELDSMDFLNLMVALRKRLGVEVPEADYPQVRTLRGITGYLAARLAA